MNIKSYAEILATHRNPLVAELLNVSKNISWSKRGMLTHMIALQTPINHSTDQILVQLGQMAVQRAEKRKLFTNNFIIIIPGVFSSYSSTIISKNNTEVYILRFHG